MTNTTRQNLRHNAWLLYLLGGSVFLLAYYCIPQSSEWNPARVFTYCLISASAVPAMLYGIAWHRPTPRLPWLMIAGSQIVYALADTSFYIAHFLFGSTRFPALADVFYIAHYPLILVGVILLIRRRSPRRDLPSMLDAAVLGVVAALVSWIYLIQPRVNAGLPIPATMASLAYPVLDLILFTVAMRLVIGSGRRPAAFFLLALNLGAFVATDSLYALQQVGGSYDAGNYLDVMWLFGNIMLGAAGLHPTMRELVEPTKTKDLSLGPLRTAALTGAALIAPTTLVVQHVRGMSGDIPMIAGACALLFLLTISRLIVVVTEQRRLAVTDALTGLHTRRHFEAHLPQFIARANRTHRTLTLLIIDIDHFKSINDRFGHPAGDRVLIETARRLRTIVQDSVSLARYGGEEFALLVVDNDERSARDIAERVRHAISDHPIAASSDSWVPVTVSVGAAHHTDQTPDQLVALADRALYSAKAQGRDRIAYDEPLPQAEHDRDHTTALTFLSGLADRVDLSLSNHVHGRAVGEWTRLVCEELGCDQSTASNAELAGRLHDIGKIVVPEAILNKPSVLTSDEWAVMREHPDHGYRLISAVPSLDGIAEIVRQHHERFDGNGYPQQLAGAAIRFEARVVAVCDAWGTMLSDRSYRAPLDIEQALEELRDGRGNQFDPMVVDAFFALFRAGKIVPPPLLSGERRQAPNLTTVTTG
ncbi:diguanylate cyclase [Parasphingorhabdus pacifica]